MPIRTVARPPAGNVAFPPTSPPTYRGGSPFRGVFDGLAIASSFLGAWSFSRRLRTPYSGPLFRSRRSTDSAERDWFGTGPNGEVNIAEFQSWCSGGNAFAVTLYDQSGLARNFAQSTTTIQPILAESGVAITENGRLAAKFVAADARRMSIASSTAMFNALHTTGGSLLIVSRANDTASPKTLIANRNGTGDFGSPGFAVHIDASERCYMQASRLTGPTTGRSVESLESATGNVANSILALVIDPDNATAASRAFGWRNGTAIAGFDNAQTGTPLSENAVSNFTLGAGGTGLSGHDGTISEVGTFSSLISAADRTAYQSRSGTFFGVTIS